MNVPAAGLEGRQARVIIKAASGPVLAERPYVILDDVPPAVTATMHGAPRFLNVPEPA